jgi:predicted RNase H-like HicB family nuclease
MRYVINVEECNAPNTVRFWGTVEGLEACHIAEDTLDEFYRSAPEVIRDVIETSNERGANLPVPSSFEFRLLA